MADDNDNIIAEDSDSSKPDKMFSLKKWNSVAMWSKFWFQSDFMNIKTIFSIFQAGTLNVKFGNFFKTIPLFNFKFVISIFAFFDPP